MWNRGIYSLLVVAHLLDIVTPELIDGTAAFIASCQTYEGGFSSASHPYVIDGMLAAQRPSLGEAHGGYTFCALASWVLLQPYLSGHDDAPRVNLSQLIRWLVHMQGREVELGGFKGRTNKLVDGCYSWWVGGAFVLLEALGVSPGAPESAHAKRETSHASEPTEGVWDDVDGALWQRLMTRRPGVFMLNQIHFSIGRRCRSISSLPDNIEQEVYATSHPSTFSFSFRKRLGSCYAQELGRLPYFILPLWLVSRTAPCISFTCTTGRGACGMER
jgi:hypothetical protein